MSEPARKPATYEDVLNAPEHQVAEVIDGELHVSPRPAPRHAFASMMISQALGPALSRRGGGDGKGWLILAEPELHLQADILVPDLAGWRSERMPHLPAEAYFTLAPDWVCEVLSPRTVRTDRTKKKNIYARRGVEFLWLVDPIARILEVYRLAGAFWQEVAVHGGGDRVNVPPFPDLGLNIDAWWEDAEEEPASVLDMPIEDFELALPAFMATMKQEWYRAPSERAEEVMAFFCRKGYLKRRLRSAGGQAGEAAYEYQMSDAFMAIIERRQKEEG